MDNESPITGQKYEIVSIKRTTPPPEGEGSDWYGYEIVQGSHTINGMRQGKLAAVTTAVEDIVEQLNERRFGKRGRVQAKPKPKPKPKAKKA